MTEKSSPAIARIVLQNDIVCGSISSVFNVLSDSPSIHRIGTPALVAYRFIFLHLSRSLK